MFGIIVLYYSLMMASNLLGGFFVFLSRFDVNIMEMKMVNWGEVEGLNWKDGKFLYIG